MILLVGMLAAAKTANAQDNVSEDQINALFASGGSTTPLLTAGGSVCCPWGGGVMTLPDVWFPPPYGSGSGYPAGDSGFILSAAYNLGGGHFLYMYQLSCASIDFTVTQLNIPLGGKPLVPIGAVTSGSFVAGAIPTNSYGDPVGYNFNGAFAWFYQGLYLANQISDPVTNALVVGNPQSPSAIIFNAPGLTPTVTGLPPGVWFSTPTFGFISNTLPSVVNGQFASDSGGNPLPAFQMVVPGVVTLFDPVPDLLMSSLPPNSPVSTNPDDLATKGRPVQGISADGATEVVLRLPAGSAGDQFALSFKNFVSINEDGAFGDALNPSPSVPSQSNLTVIAVNTSQGPMAFALYRAPKDFAQASGVGCATRLETIQVQLTPNGTSTAATATFDITIMRPPVVLVHGLWSNKAAWNNFSPLFTSNGPDPCFAVLTADYSLFQFAIATPPIVASTPPYPDAGVLQNADSSALGFGFNTLSVFTETNLFLDKFKNGGNALQIPVAAVQADFVTHSMGGDIVRTMPSFFISFFYDENTFGKGLIHKLITIGTPHLGSPLATQLPQTANACIRNLLAGQGLPSFSSVTFASGYSASGAMFDLDGDGSGSTMSQALLNIFSQGQAQLIPAAMVAGVQSDFTSLDNSTASSLIRNVICPTDFLANHLTSTGWPTIVSSNSDAVVPLASQWDGQSGIQQNGVIHSAQLAGLGFTGYGELDPGSGIPDQVILLLNTPVTNLTSFKQLTP